MHHGPWIVRFVTHAEHQGWLEEGAFLGPCAQSVHLLFVDTPAMVLTPPATLISDDGPASGGAAELWSAAQQATCIAACLGSGEAARDASEDAAKGSWICGPAADVVAFNLFALEVSPHRDLLLWARLATGSLARSVGLMVLAGPSSLRAAPQGLVIADVTGLPAVGLNPYPPPGHWGPTALSSSSSSLLSSPSSRRLARRMAEEWPYLLAQMRSESERRRSSNGDGGGGSGCGGTSVAEAPEAQPLSWEEFAHWVWPVVVSPHWRAFRRRVQAAATSLAASRAASLGAARTGQVAAEASPSSPLPPPRLFSAPYPPPLPHGRGGLVRPWLPPAPGLDAVAARAPRLAYGHAPALLPRPRHWPASAVDAGAWAQLLDTGRSPALGPTARPTTTGPPAPGPPVAFLPGRGPGEAQLPAAVARFLDGRSHEGGGADSGGACSGEGGGEGGGDDGVVYVSLGATWAWWATVLLRVSSALGFVSGSAVSVGTAESAFARGLLAAIACTGKRALVHLPPPPTSPPPPLLKSGVGADSGAVNGLEALAAAFEAASGAARILVWRGGPLPHGALFAYRLPQRRSADTADNGSGMRCGVGSGVGRGDGSGGDVAVVGCVHHGGSGTTLACAAAGLPQALLPCFFDQPLWAGTVARLRVGASVAAERLVADLEADLEADLGASSGADSGADGGGKFAAALGSAFGEALSPGCRLRAACLGKKLRDGMAHPSGSSGGGSSSGGSSAGGAAHERWCAEAVAAGLSRGVGAAALLVEEAAALGPVATLAARPQTPVEWQASPWLRPLRPCGHPATLPRASRRAVDHRSVGGVDALVAGSAGGGGQVPTVDNAQSAIHCGDGDDEECVDEDYDEKDYDALELPNGLWFESIGHEETAFLYQEIFVDEEYDCAAHGSVNPTLTSGVGQGAATSAGPRAATGAASGAAAAVSFLAGLESPGPRGVVVDCGANIGVFAAWITRRAAGPAPFRVLCVEPAPATAATLRRNLARHCPFAEVVEAALVGPRHALGQASGQASGQLSSHAPRHVPVEVEGALATAGGGTGGVGWAELVFLPRLPGNSCLVAHAPEKRRERDALLAGLGDSLSAGLDDGAGGSLDNSASPTVVQTVRARRAHVAGLYQGLDEGIDGGSGKRGLGRGGDDKGGNEGGGRVTVRATTLAALLAAALGADERVCLLKVDVEGAELEVLRGVGSGFGAWGRVDRVVAEVHDVQEVGGDPEGTHDGVEAPLESGVGDGSGGGASEHRIAGRSRKAAVDQLLRAHFPFVEWRQLGRFMSSQGPSQGLSKGPPQGPPVARAAHLSWMVYASRVRFC